MSDERKDNLGDADDRSNRDERDVYDLEPEANDEMDPEPIRSTPAPPASIPRTQRTPDEREREDIPKAASPALDRSAPFVEGFGGIKMTAIIFGSLLLVALVIVGARAGGLGITQVFIHLCWSLLRVTSIGALGTLAAIAAARCVGTRVAEPELFALRMLAAAAAFELLFATGTPIPTRIDDAIIGVFGYLTVIWLLFRLSPKETGLVAAWHAGLIGLIALAMWVRPLVKKPIQREAPRPVETQPPAHGDEVIPPPPVHEP